MLLYKNHPYASMVHDPELVNALPDFKIAIESGTYTGLGSTLMLAEKKPNLILTIESNFNYYSQALKNLAHLDFVLPYWGLSVGREDALKFIAENQDYYLEGVYIDDPDPIAFYTNEINQATAFKENLLAYFLEQYKHKDPLILLDSAGGIGYLEYLEVRKIMGNLPHTLVLDDTHHVKHFRSRYEALKIYNEVYYNEDHGSSILRIR